MKVQALTTVYCVVQLALAVTLTQAAPPYQTLGCFGDTSNRAIPILEGQDALLDGRYPARQNAITKCYEVAKKRGYKVFAVQNGGECASGVRAEQTYHQYGQSSGCGSDGEGGSWANQVYEIQAPPYQTLGCFRDTSNRAIPILEGQDALLDGSYPARQNAITKCYEVAKKRGYKVFAVQNGGQCASGVRAEQTYLKYGQSSGCGSDGEGGVWANQVYEIQDPPYQTLGCFGDTSNRAIPILEGQDALLDGSYPARQNAIRKCYEVAKKRGYKVFAVQNGGECASGVRAEQTYLKYGQSSGCGSDGEGGSWANQVYEIQDPQYQTLGCFGDTSNRAIPILEGQDALLDGSYTARQNAIRKCYEVAKKRGYKVFAVQNGGECASGVRADQTYLKYGQSSGCGSDGEGGSWANQVYEIQAPPYQTLGCFRDTSNRAIPILEGQDALLDGSYPARQNAIRKCYEVAKKRGYKVFAVQNGGECASGVRAEQTYHKYGQSSGCGSDGEGGSWANQVYEIQGTV